MVRLLRILAIALAVVASNIVLLVSARAHTEVQRSTPSPGAEVGEPIDVVELVFLDPVQPGVEISVSGPDGDAVEGLEPARLGSDGRIARVAFDPLAAEGTFLVEYEYVALDGAAQQGSYTFRREGAAPAGEPVGLADPGDPGSAGVIGLVAFLVLAVGAGLAARFRSAGRR